MTDKHHMITTCPQCNRIKDDRAILCIACWNKSGNARRGIFTGNYPRVKRDGYISIHYPSHPKSGNQGYIDEHIIILERKLGRYLKVNEICHHINGQKDDNRPENLIAVSHSKHSQLHRITGSTWKIINGRRCWL